MTTCMFCEKKAEYAFLWGAGRRWSIDNLCPNHYEERDWDGAVPIEQKHKLRERLRTPDGTR
jgi:hypothetical protein